MKKALLIKVREKIISTDDEDFFGLCTLVYLMAQNDEITEEQHDSLLEFIRYLIGKVEQMSISQTV
jgi:hypothetical protein